MAYKIINLQFLIYVKTGLYDQWSEKSVFFSFLFQPDHNLNMSKLNMSAKALKEIQKNF